MAMLGKVRRLFYQDRVSINEIARRTSLSRNTIMKWLKASGAAAHDRRPVAPTMMDTVGALEDERHPESHSPTCDRAA